MSFLTFAQKNGEILHISQVVSGLACNCICPSCGEKLIARKGNRVSHHFAHYKTDECKYGYETSLHLAAKQMIAESKVIYIPPLFLFFQDTGKETMLISEAKSIPIDDVFLEQNEGDMIPDIIVISSGKRLFIEIFVSHAVDQEKIKKLKKHNVSTIEIDLSNYKETTISKEELKEIVINDVDRKKWIHNAYVDRCLLRLKEVAEYMPKVTRGLVTHIDYCPLHMREWKGKPYANVIDDCWRCEFCISFYHKDGILCSGKNRVSQIEDFRKTYEERVAFYDNKYTSINLNRLSNRICPFCGGDLVERKSEYGNFIGCSNYPHCRFKATVDGKTGEIAFKS